MVNGQNGAIGGQRPVDWNKLWLVILLALVPGACLGLLGLVTIPLAGVGAAIGIFGFILLVIGIVVAVVLYNQANAMDDV